MMDLIDAMDVLNTDAELQLDAAGTFGPLELARAELHIKALNVVLNVVLEASRVDACYSRHEQDVALVALHEALNVGRS